MTQRSSHRRPKDEIVKISAADTQFIRDLLIYEDNEILVFNKPSGLSVQGGSGISQDLDRLLWAFANRKGRRPKLVHRLDRETSGILVVAKTTPSAAHLSAQFADRTIEKTYLALACGHIALDNGTIDMPLTRYKSAGIDLMRAGGAVDDQSQTATTDWRRVSVNGVASLIEAKPHSGRMHQIRAHLAWLGHPIAGDNKYGGLIALGAFIVPRLMLHAASLRFVHPMTGETMTFEADLPDDFGGLLSKLGIAAVASGAQHHQSPSDLTLPR